MPLIIPAILETENEAFEEKVVEVLKISGLKRIQVDFSDGVFTPTKTVQINDIGILNPAYSWEAHLMVNHPEDYFLDTKIAGFNVVIVHFEAVQPNQLQKLSESLREMKIVPALAIKTETESENILPYIELFDQILILGVSAGKQGQAMDPNTIEKIKKLKKAQKNVTIEVDGGVKIGNHVQLLEAGADMLVVGSALFENSTGKTPTQNFEAFFSLS